METILAQAKAKTEFDRVPLRERVEKRKCKQPSAAGAPAAKVYRTSAALRFVPSKSDVPPEIVATPEIASAIEAGLNALRSLRFDYSEFEAAVRELLSRAGTQPPIWISGRQSYQTHLLDALKRAAAENGPLNLCSATIIDIIGAYESIEESIRPLVFGFVEVREKKPGLVFCFSHSGKHRALAAAELAAEAGQFRNFVDQARKRLAAARDDSGYARSSQHHRRAI